MAQAQQLEHTSPPDAGRGTGDPHRTGLLVQHHRASFSSQHERRDQLGANNKTWITNDPCTVQQLAAKLSRQIYRTVAGKIT